MRENEKQANDPVGSEANPKALEMGQAIGGEGVARRTWGTRGQTITSPPLQRCSVPMHNVG